MPKTKTLEEVLTLKVLKTMMSQDPNKFSRIEDVTEATLLTTIRALKGTPMEPLLIEILDGRDLENDPIPFTDFSNRNTN